ncbi:MAG: hypothetical protein HYY17_11055 [Planctomycetes bacterium]|nr:hypothetical protein [Planctomycetota bacterium]
MPSLPGWSTVARLPFRPMRAADEMHRSLAGARNLPAFGIFFLLSSLLFCLYAAHRVWERIPEGTFLAGLAVIASALLIGTFLYVVLADILSDVLQRRRLIFPLLLSTFAISGMFSLLGAAVYEAGVLGLWKVKRAMAIGLAATALWQGAVETVNLRRVYGLRWWWAATVELVARAAGIAMGLFFMGFMSGTTRPWKHWRAVLWVFGLN